MVPPVVQLIVNPRPGWRARRRVSGLCRAFRAAGAALLVGESVAGRLEIDARSDHVCVIGGDGTLRHAIEALHRAGRSVPISAYPGGSTNLLARERGYVRSPRDFVARVLGGGTVPHYTALIEGVPLLTCASVGPDSHAIEALSPALKRRIGRAAYAVAFAKVLIRWPRSTLNVSSEHGDIACEAVYVAKGRFYAGPWTFAPDACLTDPLLHVVALERASRADFLRFVWRLWRGAPVCDLDKVRCFECIKLTLSGISSTPLQADGDVVAHLPATIALRAEPTHFA